MILSYPRTRLVSSNTGILKNLGTHQRVSLDYGNSKLLQICITSKRFQIILLLMKHRSIFLIFYQNKQIPTSLTFSPNSSHFVTISLPSRHINIFNFLTGKLTRTYDESLSAIQDMQQAGTAVYKVDDMEFGRRLAVERELEKDQRAWKTMCAVWDESGNFVIYPTLLGIKGAQEAVTMLMNLNTNLFFSPGQW